MSCLTLLTIVAFAMVVLVGVFTITVIMALTDVLSH